MCRCADRMCRVSDVTCVITACALRLLIVAYGVIVLTSPRAHVRLRVVRASVRGNGSNSNNTT